MDREGEPAVPANGLADRLSVWINRYLEGVLDPDWAVAELDEILTGVPLYPPDPLMAAGISAAEPLEKAPAKAIDLALRMVSAPAPGVRGLAVAVISRLARFQPGFWRETVRHLTTDDDSDVRALAARIFDTREWGEGAVEFHFAFVCETVREWVRDPDYRVRRAASHAVLGYAARHAEFRPRLLEMLDPLLNDEPEYVRHSFAAALRVLGRSDPDLIFQYLESALPRLTSQSREVFELVLDHPFADRRPERKAALQKRLSNQISPPSS
jgi:HEAT repeat protein